MFNRKYEKAMELLSVRLEEYKAKELRCREILDEIEYSTLDQAAHMNTCITMYRHKKEALETLLSDIKHYLS